MKPGVIFLHLFTLVNVTQSYVNYRLIHDFITRERINALISFQCDPSMSISWLKDLNANFSGSFLSFDVASASSKFYSDHHRFMTTGHHRFGLVVDWNCPEVIGLLKFCSEQSYFNDTYHWLLLVSDQRNETFTFLESLNLNIDTHLTLVVPEWHSNASSYGVYEVYGTIRRRGGKNHVVRVGEVDSAMGVRWTGSSTNTYQQRKCLDGLHLQAVVTAPLRKKNVSIEQHLLNLDPPRAYSFERVGYQISVFLSQHLNFRIQLIIADEWYFDLLGTNSSKGVFGQLQTNMVDFSVSPLSLAKERLVAYDATVSFGTARIETIFRHPKNSKTRNIFLLPFRNAVWIALLVILALASVVLLVAFCVERRSDAISNCQFLLAILGFLCQQAYSGRTSAISSRITIKAVIVFSVIVYQFYSTFIISSLLVLPPKSILTTKQLLGSDLKYSIEDLTYNHDFFNRTKDATALELYKRKILPNKYGFTNISTGLDLVRQGGHAFQCDATYAYTMILESFDEHQICELQEILLFPSRALYVPVPKGSPLKEIFRVSLRRMLETGVSGYFKRIFFPSKLQCMKKNFAFVQVGFGDIASLYRLLAVGAIAGLVVLLVEVVEFRVRSYLEMRLFLQKYPVWLD